MRKRLAAAISAAALVFTACGAGGPDGEALLASLDGPIACTTEPEPFDGEDHMWQCFTDVPSSPLLIATTWNPNDDSKRTVAAFVAAGHLDSGYLWTAMGEGWSVVSNDIFVADEIALQLDGELILSVDDIAIFDD